VYPENSSQTVSANSSVEVVGNDAEKKQREEFEKSSEKESDVSSLPMAFELTGSSVALELLSRFRESLSSALMSSPFSQLPSQVQRA
jgi:hypothetical protein